MDVREPCRVPPGDQIHERQTVWTSIQLTQRPVTAILTVLSLEDDQPLPWTLIDAEAGLLHVEALVGTGVLVTYSALAVP